MGRWQVSVSSEMFHCQTKKQPSVLSVITEIGEDQHHHHHRTQEKKRSNLTKTQAITATSDIEATMCNGSGDVPVAVVGSAEEWSPIREAPPAVRHGGYDRFLAEEQGASSDMDMEDRVPLVRGPREGVSAVGVTAAAAHPDADAKAGAADQVGSFATGIGSDEHALDWSGRVSYVTSTGDESAPKRKRIPDLGSNPVVEVTYEGLSRESKNVLRQALQSWSHWHSRTYPLGMDSTEEVLQSGTEVHSPALDLDPSINGPISVWMDKPLKRRKSRLQDIQDVLTAERQDKEKDVPLYDRACTFALSSHDLANLDEYVFVEPEESSRCFNCGSYSHALRNCPRPQSMAAIRIARDALANKRGPRPRIPSRYYQCSSGGKFDDLKPGVLSFEARKAIGIGELDPPPWLNRMREIGYPPGYLEVTQDESSGLQVIHDDTEGFTGRESIREVDDLENLTPVEELKTGPKMTVEYPGINGPLPENVDKELWAVRSVSRPVEPRGCKRPFHQISQIHSSGSGRLTPSTPTKSWGVLLGDFDPRAESYVRSISTGHSESYPATRYDGMESHIEIPGSNLYDMTSSAVDIIGYSPLDPASQWSKRRINGTDTPVSLCNNSRAGMQAYHHIPCSSSGLASPVRGMFGTPGPIEPLSSPSFMYTRHDYYQSGPQGYPLTTSQSPKPTANKAWLKAQSALDALRPIQTTGGLLPTPHRATGGGLENSRGPGMSDQWGTT